MDDFRDDGNDLALIGRLKQGVIYRSGTARGRSTLSATLFRAQAPGIRKELHRPTYRVKEYVSGKLRRSLIVLWCAVGMILLIVCVNLSNLLLARAAARSKEFAMRSALGAKRSRLVRQLLTESFVLAAAGAVVGLGLAYLAIPYLAHQRIDCLAAAQYGAGRWKVLGWTVLIAIGAAVLFGPAAGPAHVRRQSAGITERKWAWRQREPKT